MLLLPRQRTRPRKRPKAMLFRKTGSIGWRSTSRFLITKGLLPKVKWIKGRRISWLGHLERMEEDRMPKKIFTQELEGARRKGRPRKRWKEEVERDLQVLGVRKWRELVGDRKKWKDIVRYVKAHSGLGCQWKKKGLLPKYLGKPKFEKLFTKYTNVGNKNIVPY